MNNKVILTDIDGVCVNWEESFNSWMTGLGYTLHSPDEFQISDRFQIDKAQSRLMVRTFNESAKIGYLRSLRDSAYYIQRINQELGYVFHSITSLSLDPSAQKVRIMNLKDLFGPNTFDTFLFADTGQDKKHLLADYRGTNYFWVEDKIANALDGKEVGLRPILMHHAYNANFYDSDILRVSNWKEIYNLVKIL